MSTNIDVSDNQQIFNNHLEIETLNECNAYPDNTKDDVTINNGHSGEIYVEDAKQMYVEKSSR